MIPLHMLHMSLSDRLPSNSKLYRNLKNNSFEYVVLVSPRRIKVDGDVAWACIGQFFVPYMWSEGDHCWLQSLACLYQVDRNPKSPAKIPVTFSSRSTAWSVPTQRLGLI